MSKTRFVVLAVATLVAAWMVPSAAHAQFSRDAKWVPDQANSLILVNADRVFQSGLAAQEKWSPEQAFQRGMTIVPPGVGKAMFASQYDYAMMEPVWTTGVFEVADADTRLTQAAERWDSTVEDFMGRKSATLRGDLFGVVLDAGVIGVMAPGNRQSAARWVGDADAGRSRVSLYLADAIKFADQNADVILAFDLANAFSVGEARSALLRQEGLTGPDIEALSVAAARMQGLTLGITVKDKAYGAIKIDFADGTNGLDKLKKRVILELLSSNGMMVDDFNEWEVAVQGSSVTFGGWLTATGLRKVGLLVNQPVRMQFTGGKPQQGSAELNTVQITREFVDTLELYFRDLEQFMVERRSSAPRAYSLWFDKYANKIDSLSITGVDPAVVEFASGMSREFRNVALILTQSQGRIDTRTISDVDYSGSYGYGYGYGYRSGNLSRNSAARKLAKTEESAAAAAAAKEVMQQLRNQFGDLRRDIESRFGG